MASLKDFLQRITEFNPQELEHFLRQFQDMKIAKKQHLFLSGEICKLAVYLEKGCFRKYIINDKGDEVVVDFFVEDFWVGDLVSLINRTPTPYSFQALEDSNLKVLPYVDWHRMSEESPKLQEARRKHELRNHDATMALLTFEKYGSPEEKYQKMLQRFPGITNRVASIHIASYLGIKPESYSRLKRKFAGR